VGAPRGDGAENERTDVGEGYILFSRAPARDE
jgi:hypothetical protein